MDYQQTLDYLYSRLPSLDKKGWSAYKPGLDRVLKMLEVLGNPQNSYKIIHVAGTNGKGSVSHMLASVLQESGLKVGLFTSPHLKDFRERIKVDGVEVDEKEVIRFVQYFSEKIENISPSFFEYTFSLAVNHFKNKGIDVAVIETGLGGRLDCTNVVKPILSIITNISLDHEQFLGNTIAAVAKEKAGIIKMGIPSVIGRYQEESQVVFDAVASANNSLIYGTNDKQKTFPCELQGDYQLENQRTVIKSLELLRKQGVAIQEDDLLRGLQRITDNTGLKGRWQELSKSPKVICDVGHNVDGVKQLVNQLLRLDYANVRVVWGMSEDKKVEEILSLLPLKYEYYWCEANNPRALNASYLDKLAKNRGLQGQSYDSVSKAYNQALSELKDDEMIFVGGSVFVVAEVI
jgi:dihydrofolate synthase/folylpolyglutamate synthase